MNRRRPRTRPRTHGRAPTTRPTRPPTATATALRPSTATTRAATGRPRLPSRLPRTLAITTRTLAGLAPGATRDSGPTVVIDRQERKGLKVTKPLVASLVLVLDRDLDRATSGTLLNMRDQIPPTHLTPEDPEATVASRLAEVPLDIAVQWKVISTIKI